MPHGGGPGLAVVDRRGAVDLDTLGILVGDKAEKRYCERLGRIAILGK